MWTMLDQNGTDTRGISYQGLKLYHTQSKLASVRTTILDTLPRLIGHNTPLFLPERAAE